jgi:Cu(I)/Ag(I) efflux system membrane protein CusA/SilA
VRVRYPRERRDRIESLGEIFVPTQTNAQIPLTQLAQIVYVRGPQMIKSEDTFLVSYVTFDMQAGHAEVDVVEAARGTLEARLASGELQLPAGVSYSFAGSYENQIRSAERLRVVLPLALLIILLILYFQFNSLALTLMVFSGIFVAWAGGFILIWLYAQPWFLDIGVFGVNLRDVFQMHPINLSVAIWVGFIALFGIASDNGVLVASLPRSGLSRAATRQHRASTRERDSRGRAPTSAGPHHHGHNGARAASGLELLWTRRRHHDPDGDSLVRRDALRSGDALGRAGALLQPARARAALGGLSPETRLCLV